MFEENLQNRKYSQETASSTPLRTMSFSGDHNESVTNKLHNEQMGKQSNDKYLKRVLPECKER